MKVINIFNETGQVESFMISAIVADKVPLLHRVKVGGQFDWKRPYHNQEEVATFHNKASTTKYISYYVNEDDVVFVIFGGNFNHNDVDDIITKCFYKNNLPSTVRSAGFVSSDYECYGKSYTLTIGSLDGDSELLKAQLEGKK